MQPSFSDSVKVIRFAFVFLAAFFVVALQGLHAQHYWSAPKTPEVQQQQVTAYERLVFWDAAQWMQQRQQKGTAVPTVIALPNEREELEEFTLTATAVLAPAIAEKYPTIQTFSAHSTLRPQVYGRITLTPLGVSAWLRLPNQEDVFIQPEKGVKGQHRVYQKRPNAPKAPFWCKTATHSDTKKPAPAHASQRREQQLDLKTFRLAITASGEYTQYWDDDDPSNGDARADAFAAIVNTVNRINEVYETDLGVRLQLVTDANLLYDDPFTDPFTGNLNQEAQSTLTAEVGEAQYDIGHLFGQGGSANGDAGCLGCVCVDNSKGQGYSIYPNPANSETYLSDYFDLDYAAHEMGHQFGAYHTFSHINEGMGASVEPGSGSTIMGYAGITGSNNVQSHGDPYFHAKSIENITAYITEISCYASTPVSNQPPVVDAGPDYFIPIGTAYALTATATDPDGDTLYYTWEQMDDGNIENENFGPTNFSGALARSLPPTTSPIRSIPNEAAVRAGTLTQTTPNIYSSWETVATVGRTMNWAVTARDRFAEAGTSGGRTHRDDVLLTVVDTQQPFTVLPNETDVPWKIGARRLVRWEVANTNLAPIGVETVSIFLSTDDGETFPYLLTDSAANDGEAWVTVPIDATTTTARIKVAANNNIFYALSSSSFDILSRPYYLTFTNYTQLSCNSETVTYNFSFVTTTNENATVAAHQIPEGFNVTITPTNVTPNATGTIQITPSENVAHGPQEFVFRVQSGAQIEDFNIQLDHYTTAVDPPNLSAPSTTAANVPLGPVLVWQAEDNASSYQFQLATTDTFNPVVQEVTTTGTTFALSDLLPNQNYFWRVKAINPCGESAFSAPYSFETTSINCEEYTADGLPTTINDASSVSPGITRKTLYVENDNPISSVTVHLNLTHSYVSDLSIALIAPSGQKALLVQNTGGSGNNFTNTVFTASADNDITLANPPFTGSFLPMESFNKFKGESSFGNWILEIIDNAEQDAGSLLDFSLELCLEGALAVNTDGDIVVDTLDNCPLVANDNQNDYDNDGVGDVCDLDGQNNFSIYKADTTCVNKNNGTLQLNVLADFDYSVQIQGPSGYQKNFTMDSSGLSVNNLTPGDYLLCITSPEDSSFERCFSTTIAAPELMQVQSVVNPNTQSLDVTITGTTSFEIELNGKNVTNSTLNPKRLPLKKGANYLKVTNTLACQEVFERVVYLSNAFMAYPNPTSSAVNILAPDGTEGILLTISTIDGTVLKQAKPLQSTTLGTYPVDLSPYPPGIYLLQLQTPHGVETLKIIRK